MAKVTQTDYTRPTLGKYQVAILLLCSCPTVLYPSLVGPSLAKMETHFSHMKFAESLSSLAMTIPLLAMAMFSIAAGRISDRYGRKNIFVGAGVLYALFGTAPLYLTNLEAIVATRYALGAAGAFVGVTGVALISDFYDGERREKLIALQVTVACLVGFTLSTVSGVLGDISWRLPHGLYALGGILAVLVAALLSEPQRHKPAAAKSATESVDTKLVTVGILTCIGVYIGFSYLTAIVSYGRLFTIGMGVEAYRLNKFLHDLIYPAHREAFKADEEAAYDAAGLNETEKNLVRERDWIGLIQYGVIFFMLEKLGAVVGIGNPAIYASMRGETMEEFHASRNANMNYSVAGGSEAKKLDEQD